MLGEEAQKVEKVKEKILAQIKSSKNTTSSVGNWTFNIEDLSPRMQELFNTTKPMTQVELSQLELEMLQQCDEQSQIVVMRVIQQARVYLAAKKPHRANAVLRGFASRVSALGLTELVFAQNDVYQSPLGTMEVPFYAGTTIKVGYPMSEIYIGSAKLYEKGGYFEGYEPIFVDTKILAATGDKVAAGLIPVYGTAKSVQGAAQGLYKIAKTVSAPALARYQASERGISLSQFNEHFEEEIIPEYRIPGTNMAYKMTYRLRNRKTGQVYESSYSASDVVSVAGTVTKALDGMSGVTNNGPSLADACETYSNLEAIIPTVSEE